MLIQTLRNLHERLHRWVFPQNHMVESCTHKQRPTRHRGAVEQFGGCPQIVRTDQGTENVVIRYIQTYLRRNDADNRFGGQSYISGASTTNQRIESWWGTLRREGMEYWIQLLNVMKDEDLFFGDHLDKSLCFRNFIQEHLDEIKVVWYSHRIRPTRNPNVPGGIPEVMYTVTQLWGSEDFIVPHDDIHECKQACRFITAVPCNEYIFDRVEQSFPAALIT